VELPRALSLLEESARGRGAPHVPRDAEGLIELIIDRHHVFTRDELDRLVPLASKVLRVHGMRHPALEKVSVILHALVAELMPHMEKEERVLFPYILQLAAGVRVTPHFGTVLRPIAVMNHEHEEVGALLRELSDATEQYTPPAFACASFRALYEGLRELQADIHEHVHLENNVLFPLAERLEARV